MSILYNIVCSISQNMNMDHFFFFLIISHGTSVCEICLGNAGLDGLDA